MLMGTFLSFYVSLTTLTSARLRLNRYLNRPRLNRFLNKRRNAAGCGPGPTKKSPVTHQTSIPAPVVPLRVHSGAEATDDQASVRVLCSISTLRRLATS